MIKPYEVTNPNELSDSEKKEYDDWLAKMGAEQDTYDQIQSDMDKANKEYEAKWPKYCKKCKGWGVFTWRENASPHGSGEYWPMDMSDPCEDCVGKGICARCGELGMPVVDDELLEGPCTACGWKYDTGLQVWS